MPPIQLPLIVEPAELERHLGTQGLLIVDMSKPESYARQHLPGAVYLDYSQIVAARPPIMGLLPDDAQLSKVLSYIGIHQHTHVVAYDDEGGAKASRLLWTLEVVGHAHYSLLNGGLRAWQAGQHPVSADAPTVIPTDYRVKQRSDAVADKAYIQAHLNDPSVALLDTRSLAEYRGVDKRAQRGGHIPGAVHMEWTAALNIQDNLRLKPEAELRALLSAVGVTQDKKVVAYCQTHHRSSHTFIMLKALGYEHIRGYPGAWSEWGNSADTPVE
jgi:thiosulfate/3-mercaptopyruvate sulfurtransferase